MRKLQEPLIFPPRIITSSNGVHYSGYKIPGKPYIIEKRDDGYYWFDRDAENRIVSVKLQGPHKNQGLAAIAFNKFYRGK